jgi:hypothetical protein
MAKPRRQQQHKLSCQLHSLADRHTAQKLAQVYRWLVPEDEEPPTGAAATLSHHSRDEKNSSHLR